jgi:uncharacterized protein
MEASTNTVSAVPYVATAREDPAADERELPQLGLGKILGVWAAAALPMGILAWVVAPLVADQLTGAGTLARSLLITLTAGLVWQFVLVMILVGREQGTLRPSVLRDALWLRSPRSPRTGKRGGRLWLIVVPLIVLFAAEEFVPAAVTIPAGHDMVTFLESDSGEALLSGSWGLFALIAALVVFNTVLGEELLFRGYLLPRMNDAFGRRDWVANGVLFAVYHLHMPWVIPAALIGTFSISYPAKRYRSAFIGIVVHSAQSVVILALVLALVLQG